MERRRFLKDGLLAAGAALVATPVAAAAPAPGGAAVPAAAGRPDRHPAEDRLLTRIAWGSCAKEDQPQPIWDAVLASRPDLFLFLGDNVYGDTRDITVLKGKYAQLGAKPGFQALKAAVPLAATWDDHDYGENDAGADYPMKEASREAFCDFWGEAADSPRRTRDGIYTAYVFGPPGRRVQVILPDLRYNRTPIPKLELGVEYKPWAEALHKAGRQVPGPYARENDHGASMLGEAQWQWLEAQLRVPAEVRIFASSLQVVADFPGWEGWTVYARDHQRLVQAIRANDARGLFCLSGDTHYGEVSCLDVNVPYPLWDFTSSGLTEVWPVEPPNANRLGPILREQNFGFIDINWKGMAPRVTVQVRDVKGTPRLEQVLDIDRLRA
jgi:alkaline phosphatase D